jgi:single-strand DNA-binding protein
VLFEGKNHTRAWEDKDGIKRYTTEIIANNMQMLDSPKKGDDEPDVPTASDESAPITTPDCPF